MNRRPVGRSGGQQAPQAKESGGSAQADPQRIAKVLGRQTRAAWYALYTEGAGGKIPGDTKENRDTAEIKKHSEERPNGNDAKRHFERNGGVVKIEERGDAVAEREDGQEPEQSPERPKPDAPPRNRSRGFRFQIFHVQDQHRGGEPQEKQSRNDVAEERARERKFLVFAAPVFGNLDIGAVVGYFIAQNLHVNARIGVIIVARGGGR